MLYVRVCMYVCTYVRSYIILSDLATHCILYIQHVMVLIVPEDHSVKLIKLHVRHTVRHHVISIMEGVLTVRNVHL